MLKPLPRLRATGVTYPRPAPEGGPDATEISLVSPKGDEAPAQQRPESRAQTLLVAAGVNTNA